MKEHKWTNDDYAMVMLAATLLILFLFLWAIVLGVNNGYIVAEYAN